MVFDARIATSFEDDELISSHPLLKQAWNIHEDTVDGPIVGKQFQKIFFFRQTQFLATFVAVLDFHASCALLVQYIKTASHKFVHATLAVMSCRSV